MHEVVAIDSDARTVTVGCGDFVWAVESLLEGKGWALHNLASLPHISVAGAWSTATHGSGEGNGNLATAVVGLELVTAGGDLVKLSKAQDGEAFRGAVVGLGALGAITKVTLAVQPTYQVRQYVYEDMPLAQMRDHFDEIQASGYSVSLFTDWQKQRVNEVWVKSRVGAGRVCGAGGVFWGEVGDEEFASDCGDLRGELHGADGGGGALVRPVAALQDGVYAERGQGIADGIFCAAGACGGCDFGGGAAAGSGVAAFADIGNTDDCGG